jgi:hypothetical protein
MHPILPGVKLPEALLFASNAQLACAAGTLFLFLAAATRVADRRRTQRQRIDRVGWMPWTGMFLVCAVIGLTLLGLGLPGLLKGEP